MSRRTNGQSEPSDSPVVRLKEYEVIKKLGRGGMGIVYLVRHRLTKRLEVLKVLRPPLASRQRLRERFLREVQGAARLDHPNIVKTFTAIQNGELLGLVMEYVDGQDLESLVRRSGPLTVPAAASIIQQTALGLQHATDRGLIHRDIKPSNILVSRSAGRFVAKLSDFGLSKLNDESDNDGLTVAGRFLGTPDYMAPEQALDASRATVAADIYGLGCSLYFALVGQPPYTGGNALKVLNAHINAPVPDACLSRHDIPPELGAIIQRMLQKDPRDRYLTAADVAVALKPFTLPGTRGEAAKRVSSATPTQSDQNTNGGLSIDGLGVRASQSSGSEYQSSVRKIVPAPRRRTGAPLWQTLLQIAMPVALAAVLFYFQPWMTLQQNSDGTLLLKELTPGTTIEIDNSIKVAATDQSNREIRLPPGSHTLRFVYDGQTVSQRSIEIKSNATVELSASFTGLNSRKRSKPSDIPANNASRNAQLRESDSKPSDAAAAATLGGSNKKTDAVSTAPAPIIEQSDSDESSEAPARPVQPTLNLTNAAWNIELERHLSGLSTSADGLLILPRDITDLRTELVIATGSKLSAWDAKTGFPQSIFAPFNVTGISVANNQKSVLYFDDSKCEVWVVQKPRPKLWFSTQDRSPVKCVFVMSTDSRFLACCNYNESFIRWDLKSKMAVSTMAPRHPLTASRVQSLQITSRLDSVVVLGSDGSLSCWDSSDGEQLGHVDASSGTPAFDAEPIDLHINNIARNALVVRRDGQVETRKLPTLELIARQKVTGEPVVTSSYSPRLLAIATQDGAVSMVDGASFEHIGTINGPADTKVATTAVSLDGKCIAVAYADASIYLARIRKTPGAGKNAIEQPSATIAE